MASRLPRTLAAAVSFLLVAVLLTLAPPQLAQAQPTFRIDEVATGLAHPWDLTFLDDDLMLFDERAGTLWSKRGDGKATKVTIDLPDLFVNKEGGLLGIVAAPDSASSRVFYTCQSTTSGGKPQDVRVLRWRLTSDTKAEKYGTNGGVVLTGLPTNQGRHNGCRLRFGPDGKLYVGTGDAALYPNPQDLTSLGGKVLRVNADGTVPSDNPFRTRTDNGKYVWTYGHRNVQGLAVRPGTTEIWNAEQGTYRDDEVNLNLAGKNYGWQPGKGYDESPPMTDRTRYPDAIPARWSSGKSTIAVSGLTFIEGPAWGHWQGAAAIGVLKDMAIELLELNPAGQVVQTERIPGLDQYKRIRTVQMGPDGSLYFTTDNGSKDVVGRITPTAVAPRVEAGSNASSVGVSAVRTDGDVYAFLRSTGSKILFKRSTDDGHTWPATWTDTGVTSTTAPAVASSAPGRVDLLIRGSNARTTHVWFVDGVKAGSIALGGDMASATLSSADEGTLDALGLGKNGKIYRKHFDGSWSTHWEKLGGVYMSSRAGAAPNATDHTTVITARGLGGGTYQRSLTPSSNGSGWVKVPGALWSARALGDSYSGKPELAVSRGSDGYVALQSQLGKNDLVMAVQVRVTGDPDIVARPDGTWLLFAADPSGVLTYYDARSGEYTPHSLGGTVR